MRIDEPGPESVLLHDKDGAAHAGSAGDRHQCQDHDRPRPLTAVQACAAALLAMLAGLGRSGR